MQYRLIGLILIVTSLAYIPSLWVPFYFDDFNELLLNNPLLREFQGLTQIWNLYPSRSFGLFSFALNFMIDSMPWHFHLVNVLIHIVNSVLVFKLCILFANIFYRDKNSKSILWCATGAALFFSCHPINTQAVTYISQRYASLATLFYLAGVIFFLRYRVTHKKRELWGVFICSILGFMTKETVATFGVTLILLDRVLNPRTESKLGHEYIKTLLFGFLLLVPIGIYLFGVDHIKDSAVTQARPTVLHYFYTQTTVLWKYWQLIVWPVSQNLDYDYPLFKSLSLKVSISLLAHAAFVWVLLRLRKVRPLISLGGLFFYVALFPESSFVPLPDYIFEHRLYLPMVGVSLVVMGLLTSLSQSHPSRQKLPVMVMVSFVAFLTFLTFDRNSLWMDEVKMWEDVTQKSPQKERPKLHLARAYIRTGLWPKAESIYSQLLKTQPDDPYILKAKATVQWHLKDFQGGIKTVEKLLKIADHPDIYGILALFQYHASHTEKSKRTQQKCRERYGNAPQCVYDHLDMPK